MGKELKEIKNNFKVNHAARMVNLERAINSLKKTQNSESSGTKKNQSRLKACNDLLASL